MRWQVFIATESGRPHAPAFSGGSNACERKAAISKVASILEYFACTYGAGA
jgi:hypothetical protein